MRILAPVLTLLAVACSNAADEQSNAAIDKTEVAASPGESAPSKWPFEECDRQGTDHAVTACLLEDLQVAEAELNDVVRQAREATRKEGYDMGARDDPEDPERTLSTAYGLSNFTDSFDQMQAAWEELKDRQCDWDTIVAFAGQGSGRHLFYIECEIEMVEARTEFLKEQLESDRFAF